MGNKASGQVQTSRHEPPALVTTRVLLHNDLESIEAAKKDPNHILLFVYLQYPSTQRSFGSQTKTQTKHDLFSVLFHTESRLYHVTDLIVRKYQLSKKIRMTYKHKDRIISDIKKINTIHSSSIIYAIAELPHEHSNDSPQRRRSFDHDAFTFSLSNLTWGIQETSDNSKIKTIAPTTLNSAGKIETSLIGDKATDAHGAHSVKTKKKVQLEKREFCAICLSAMDDDMRCMLSQCHHSFCKECITKCIIADIQQRAKLPVCPQCAININNNNDAEVTVNDDEKSSIVNNKDRSSISKSLIDKLLGKNELRHYYLLLEQKKIIEKNKHYFYYCPNNKCQFGMFFNGINYRSPKVKVGKKIKNGKKNSKSSESGKNKIQFSDGTIARKIPCPECNATITISKLSEWDINEVNNYNQTIALLKSSKESCSQCPQCGEIIIKQFGCNHIRCRCGAHFCFLCRESLSPSNYAAHFQDTSNDCVYWHDESDLLDLNQDENDKNDNNKTKHKQKSSKTALITVKPLDKAERLIEIRSDWRYKDFMEKVAQLCGIERKSNKHVNKNNSSTKNKHTNKKKHKNKNNDAMKCITDLTRIDQSIRFIQFGKEISIKNDRDLMKIAKISKMMKVNKRLFEYYLTTDESMHMNINKYLFFATTNATLFIEKAEEKAEEKASEVNNINTHNITNDVSHVSHIRDSAVYIMDVLTKRNFVVAVNKSWEISDLKNYVAKEWKLMTKYPKYYHHIQSGLINQHEEKNSELTGNNNNSNKNSNNNKHSQKKRDSTYNKYIEDSNSLFENSENIHFIFNSYYLDNDQIISLIAGIENVSVSVPFLLISEHSGMAVLRFISRIKQNVNGASGSANKLSKNKANKSKKSKKGSKKHSSKVHERELEFTVAVNKIKSTVENASDTYIIKEDLNTQVEEAINLVNKHYGNLKDINHRIGLLSLYLYTTDLFYDTLNAKLRSNADIDMWQYYLCYFQIGISKLPYHEPKSIVYRGISNVETLEHYDVGGHICWPGISSATTDKTQAIEIALEQQPSVVFEIMNIDGRNISHLSEFSEENEIVFAPYSHFLILDCNVIEYGKSKDKLIYFKLRQTQVPKSSQVILWIDDNPQDNAELIHEIEQSLPNTSIVTCLSTYEAIHKLTTYNWLMHLQNTQIRVITDNVRFETVNVNLNENMKNHVANENDKNKKWNYDAGINLIQKLRHKFQFKYEVLIFCGDVEKARQNCKRSKVTQNVFVTDEEDVLVKFVAFETLDALYGF